MAIAAFFKAVQAARTMANVQCLIGEEHLATNSPLPKLVMVPKGGPYTDRIQGGYAKATLTTSLVDRISLRGVDHEVDCHLYAASIASNAQEVDQYDAAEDLRVAFVQAVEIQKPAGLYYRLVSERWAPNASRNKYGRVLIVTVRLEVTIPREVGSIANVTTVHEDIGLQNDAPDVSFTYIAPGPK